MDPARQRILAIDLGGTHTRVARADASGRILAQGRTKTPAKAGPRAVVERIVALVDALRSDEADDPRGNAIDAVCAAAPGPLDPAEGVVHATPNLRGWEGFRLADALADALGAPAWVHNDACLAALGEALRGAGVRAGEASGAAGSTPGGGGAAESHAVDDSGQATGGRSMSRDAEDLGPDARTRRAGQDETEAAPAPSARLDPLVYLTVSTGVGGGIVERGRIFEGRYGLAGELGHMIVRAGGPRCNFGHPGCLEGLSSGTALARAALERLRAGGPEASASSLASQREELTAKTVAEAARAGDALAQQLVADVAEALGLAVGSFVNAFDPAVIVIGGGLGLGAWDLLAESVRQHADQVVMSPEARTWRLERAALGDDAGLVGAAIHGGRRLAGEGADARRA